MTMMMLIIMTFPMKMTTIVRDDYDHHDNQHDDDYGVQR